MTKQNYRKRYEALGYNVSSWARYCGVSRTTIIDHNKMEYVGDIDRIPTPFFVIIGLLEDIKNARPSDWPDGE